ncbi:SDR family NAD(P)-dependent oxidoreductase [Lactobacillus kalixensis]|nr:SDR family oxidoreductase [Lactobacillus kalixensis]
MSQSQQGKTALITGSYGGLGTQFVNIHASNGGDLILVGRSSDKLEAQKNEVTKKYNVTAHTIAIDLSKPEAAQTIYDTCKNNGWTVDYLINNAGFGGQGEFIERSMEQDMSMIAVNIETPTRLAKLFLPDFVKRGHGKLLNVSSTAAVMPGPLQAVYYATKAYVTSWSEALWRETRDTGVTVTVLMPGAMQTGFISSGNLGSTQLFANAVKPDSVAKAGYEGMLEGKLDVTAGLTATQKPFMAMAPMLPKKMLMDNVYKMQEQGSRRK